MTEYWPIFLEAFVFVNVAVVRMFAVCAEVQQ